MKLSEIISKLEKRYPLYNKESWDNVGLLVGRKNKEVKKIQISLDVTSKVIEEAIKNNVDLIISHHPIIFSSLKEINDGTILGKKLMDLIENKIAVYSLHTNLDSTIFGLNDLVGEKLGLKNGKIIDEIKENLYRLEIYPVDNEKVKEILAKEQIDFECIENQTRDKISVIDKKEELLKIVSKLKGKSLVDESCMYMLENKYTKNGIGRLYSLDKREKLISFIDVIKEKFGLETLTISGYNFNEKEIKKIAIVNGAGSSYWKKAKRMGADVLITGDLKYHEALDAKEEGMYIIDVGHYESEHFFDILIKDCLGEISGLELYSYNDEAVLMKI